MRAALLLSSSSPAFNLRTTTTTIAAALRILPFQQQQATMRSMRGRPTAASSGGAPAAVATAARLGTGQHHRQPWLLCSGGSNCISFAATLPAQHRLISLSAAASSDGDPAGRRRRRPSVAASASASASSQQQQALASIRAHLASRLPTHCCGCGVRLQLDEPDGPGFFQVPARLTELAEAVAELTSAAPAGADAADPTVDDGDSAGTSGAPPLSDEERRRRAFDRAAEAWLDTQQRPSGAGAVTPSSSSASSASSRPLSAAMAAAAAFDAVAAAPSQAIRRVTFEGSDAFEAAVGSGSQQQSQSSSAPPLDLLCARCFSLTHYGRVRSALAEAAMPEFDLARKVGRKIALQRDRRATVMVVVDITDFDGSLPRAALQALLQGSPAGSGGGDVGAAAAAASAARARRGLGGGGGYGRPSDDLDPDDPNNTPFTLVVAANKFDLLPTQATAARVERWVRLRLRQAGLPRPERVFMTSAATGVGVRPMLEQLRNGMAFREDLWVVGAQNAGKSSLIAAMQRAGAGTGGGGGGGGASAPPSYSNKQPPGLRSPTIAPVPGTTLGVLRVSGIPLGPKQRVFDTPGVPHSHQLTSRLPLAEAAALLPARRLKPRTWRLPEGTTILAGGLVRVDLLEVPGPTMYVTLFAADTVGCHAGKTAAAEERRASHAGGLLVPPYGPAALEAAAAMGSKGKKGKSKEQGRKGRRLEEEDEDEEDEDVGGGRDSDDDGDLTAAASKAALVDLPELVPQDVRVVGESWREHTVDVAIAGLGWVALGCSGEARLRVWAPRGTAVTTHDALIPDFARVFERPGFSRGLPAGGVAAAGGISLKSSGGGGGGRGGGGGKGKGRGGGGGGGRGGGGRGRAR
jgi:hypothetical protein